MPPRIHNERRVSRPLLAASLIGSLAASAGCHSTPRERQPRIAPIADAACPLVPLQMALVAPDGTRHRVLDLDAQGTLRNAMDPQSEHLATLDPRGCLVVAGDTEVESTSSGSIWTRYEQFDFNGNTLRLPNGRSLRLTDRGEVEPHGADGGLEETGYGHFTIVGYTPRATCAARMLLATFFASMPSMAMSDGHPQALPPPAHSPCPHAAHAATTQQ